MNRGWESVEITIERRTNGKKGVDVVDVQLFVVGCAEAVGSE